MYWLYLWSFRRHPHLISISKHAKKLLLPYIPSNLLLQHSRRKKRRKLVNLTNSQNTILCRIRILTGNPQYSGQWLIKQSRNRLGNQISVKLFRHFRVETSDFTISLINSSVTGWIKLRKTKLTSQNKPSTMSKRDSFQVVTKHVTMYFWVFYI